MIGDQLRVVRLQRFRVLHARVGVGRAGRHLTYTIAASRTWLTSIADAVGRHGGVMDATLPRGPSPGYPAGYVNYQNIGGQSVNPRTGQTIAPNNPLWHIPLTPPQL